jgi:hypothetical protein
LPRRRNEGCDVEKVAVVEDTGTISIPEDDGIVLPTS